MANASHEHTLVKQYKTFAIASHDLHDQDVAIDA